MNNKNQNKLSHKPNNKDKYNNDYYNQVDYTYDDMISEECAVCGKELTKTKDILVEVEYDRYVCHQCKDEYGLDTIPCREIY